MVDTLTNLQQVYAKWEGNNPYKRTTASNSYGNRAPPQLRLNPGGSGNDYDRMMSSGRDAWKSRYKSTNPQVPFRRTRKPRHRENGYPVVSASEAISSSLSHFKSSPTVHPAPNVRPFTARCCSCMPNSKNQFYSESIRDDGFHDILQVETLNEENGWLTRTFCYYAHVMSKECAYKYPEISELVLSSPKLQEAVSKTLTDTLGNESDTSPGQLKKEHKKIESRAKRAMNRMKAVISSRLVRFTAWFLHKLLSRLLSSIVVHKGQMAMVKQACQRNVPVIFLPTHRSHLDYILITFILFNYGIMAPHVAAGDNLLIPVFGTLMRGLGGYFIRRKLDKEGRKDYVYRAVLQAYMDELLKRNQFFEFFVEGGRTRSGKALYPKGGLLSVIVDAYNENMMSDAYIVPISISYDRLMDGNFCREQMGEPKVRESFWGAVTAIWKIVMSRYGAVRVDFSQPFSIKEYMQISQSFHSSSLNSALADLSPGSESPTTPDFMKVIGSEVSLYGTDIVVEDQRHLVQGLAEHIVHEQYRVSATMTTHMVCLLLLTKHRKGTSLAILIEDFEWLKQEVLARGRDLGFRGKTVDVLSHALSLLGDRLVKTEPLTTDNTSSTDPDAKDKVSNIQMEKKNDNNNDIDNVFIRPSVSLPDVFELSYYGNIANSVFVVESALANALYSLVDKNDWLCNSSENKISVSQASLLNRAHLVIQYLKYEYIFTPPCVPIDQTLNEAFDQFTCAEILQREEEEDCYTDNRERDFARRLDKSLSFGLEDDSDEEEWDTHDTLYIVNTDDSYCMAKLQFLRSVLGPILENYYVTACNLVSLLEQDFCEEDFIKRVHVQLKERVASGVASYAESASLDTLKNAVRSFQHHKIVDCYKVANLRMMTLRHQYQQEDSLNQFISQFEAYRE